MRKARFWFRVRGVAHHVDVIVDRRDTARSAARWALQMLQFAAGPHRREDVALITGRYLPEGA